MKNLIKIFFISVFLSSCGGLGDAGKVLRNEKIKSSDEFLVKKREPLVMPPDFNKLPIPNEKIKVDEDDKTKLEKLIRSTENSKIEKKTSTTENSIIDKINK